LEADDRLVRAVLAERERCAAIVHDASVQLVLVHTVGEALAVERVAGILHNLAGKLERGPVRETKGGA
jgi:hypothetical protein